MGARVLSSYSRAALLAFCVEIIRRIRSSQNLLHAMAARVIGFSQLRTKASAFRLSAGMIGIIVSMHRMAMSISTLGFTRLLAGSSSIQAKKTAVFLLQ